MAVILGGFTFTDLRDPGSARSVIARRAQPHVASED
jgi:hypothetical protein